MAEGKPNRLTYEQMAERIQRGETVILADGTRARSLADLPAPTSEQTPAASPAPVTPPVTPPNPPTPQGGQQPPQDDGLDKKTKAELIEIAITEGSEPKAGTNDEIREGIRKKRAEATS
ncbi:MAG: hypothetical protein ACO1SV_21540 [Fimbriimonas sp.]